MLILTRKKDESIMIGDDIEIMVIAIHADNTHIGITAPKDIPVHRKEVYEAIQRKKEQNMKTIEVSDETYEKIKDQIEAGKKKEKTKFEEFERTICHLKVKVNAAATIFLGWGDGSYVCIWGPDTIHRVIDMLVEAKAFAEHVEAIQNEKE